MQPRVTRTTASVGSMIFASGTSSMRTSPAAYMIVARIRLAATRRQVRRRGRELGRCSFVRLSIEGWLGAGRLRRAGMEAVVLVGGLGATSAPRGKRGQRDEAERDHDGADGGWAGFTERGVKRVPADGGA